MTLAQRNGGTTAHPVYAVVVSWLETSLETDPLILSPLVRDGRMRNGYREHVMISALSPESVIEAMAQDIASRILSDRSERHPVDVSLSVTRLWLAEWCAAANCHYTINTDFIDSHLIDSFLTYRDSAIAIYDHNDFAYEHLTIERVSGRAIIRPWLSTH
jgi:hypothetical protein